LKKIGKFGEGNCFKKIGDEGKKFL